MTVIRKVLLLSHRYLGIAISLLVVMWFVSGIVMMYAGGMPRVSPEMRQERTAALDLSKVRLSVSEAAERLEGRAGRPTLLTVMNRPVYRFTGRPSTTIFADTGERMEELTLDQAKASASQFLRLPEDKLRFVRTLEEIDQWTLLQSRQMPLHKFAADDADGTEIYVQPETGDVVMLTTGRSRALAWAGVIPHWMYFTALRANQPLWYQIMVWASAAGLVLAVLGWALGATLFRKPKPFTLPAVIPYKGWMRWHFITGMVFGLFTITWAFSGLISMEPFAWTQATGLSVRGDIFNGGSVDLEQFPGIDAAKWDRLLNGRAVQQVGYARINGDLYFDVQRAPAEALETKQRERLHQPYNVTGRADENRMLVSAHTLQVHNDPIPTETLVAKLKAALPEAPVVEQAMLSEYDSYYYSRGHLTPLPVLRVKFADPAETWVYVEPKMGQVLSTVHRLNRVERWLYSGLHSLDFSFWYDKRPLWDIGMLTLLLGGLVSSGIGLVFGLKRVIGGVTPRMKPVITEDVRETVAADSLAHR